MFVCFFGLFFAFFVCLVSVNQSVSQSVNWSIDVRACVCVCACFTHTQRERERERERGGRAITLVENWTEEAVYNDGSRECFNANEFGNMVNTVAKEISSPKM